MLDVLAGRMLNSFWFLRPCFWLLEGGLVLFVGGSYCVCMGGGGGLCGEREQWSVRLNAPAIGNFSH